MNKTNLDFELRTLWEFDFGSKHITVKADAWDRTYLFTEPRKRKGKHG